MSCCLHCADWYDVATLIFLVLILAFTSTHEDAKTNADANENDNRENATNYRYITFGEWRRCFGLKNTEEKNDHDANNKK